MELKRLVNGFDYASDGIVYSLSSQRNMKVHFSFALFTLLLAMLLHFQYMDTVVILIAIGLIIAFETLNTAIERAVDLTTGDYHHLAKLAKDAAAGSVLIIAIVVLPIGAITMLPYFLLIIQEGWIIQAVHPPSFFASAWLFLILLTYCFKAFWYKKAKVHQPHSFLAVLLFLAALSLRYFPFVFLILLIPLMLYIKYLFKNKLINWIGIVQNGIISIAGFYLLFRLFY